MAVQEDGPAFRGGLTPTVDIIIAVKGIPLGTLDGTLQEAIKVSEGIE